MACNHCSVKFNFFHKEMGCSNCGLSFCNKCLKQKCTVPSKGPGEWPVCRSCYAKLSSGSTANSTNNIPPPDAYFKRLENLDNPTTPTINVHKKDKVPNLKPGLNPADQQLLERLENLKDKGKSTPPTEEELRSRLASLKGENNYVEGPSKPMLTVDTRTDQQKIDSLLDQFVSERDIELAHNPEREIEARIATLREKGVRPNEGAYIANLHDSSSSEEEVDKITKKIMEKVALDEKNPLRRKHSSHDSAEERDNSSPELPWCVLCNKDAKYRCIDCGDLYCSKCNKEVHKTWGETDHTVIEYKQNSN